MCYFTKFVPTLSKQSKAQQNMGAGTCLFCSSNKLPFDLLTLKMMSESREPIVVFLGLSVLYLGSMYATDVRLVSSLNASALWGRGHNNTNCNVGTGVDGQLPFWYMPVLRINFLPSFPDSDELWRPSCRGPTAASVERIRPRSGRRPPTPRSPTRVSSCFAAVSASFGCLRCRFGAESINARRQCF